jgi:hypothetical protein
MEPRASRALAGPWKLFLANPAGQAQKLVMFLYVSLIMLLQGEWSPPAREMPTMPLQSELDGGWRANDAVWFAGLGEDLGEVRLSLEGGRGRAGLARFSIGAHPVETWSDRNGDGRADMIEIYDAWWTGLDSNQRRGIPGRFTVCCL